MRPPRPSAEAIRRAEEKNAAAMRLLAKGKLREALNDLNDAIWIAPSYPRSYVNRADVFERLGMAPQADADRQRAQQLAPTAGQADEGSVEEALPPAAASGAEASGSGSSGGRHPSISIGGLLWPWMVRTVLGLVAVAAIAAGVLFGTGILDDGDSDVASFSSPSPSPTITATPTVVATPVPTATATATPIRLPVGNPFSFVDLQEEWEARDIVVAPGDLSAGYSGFSIAPLDVSLVRGNASMELSLFVYGNREGARGDWALISGRAPAPKEGRSLPDHGSVWWNRNMVVVTLSRTGDIGFDALDGFLSLIP